MRHYNPIADRFIIERHLELFRVVRILGPPYTAQGHVPSYKVASCKFALLPHRQVGARHWTGAAPASRGVARHRPLLQSPEPDSRRLSSRIRQSAKRSSSNQRPIRASCGSNAPHIEITSSSREWNSKLLACNQSRRKARNPNTQREQRRMAQTGRQISGP